MNFISNVNFRSNAPLLLQILTGKAASRPTIKTKDPELNAYVIPVQHFGKPLKGEFLIRFAPLCSLELNFSNQHCKLISNSLDHVSWLENELNIATYQELENGPEVNIFMNVYSKFVNCESNPPTWTKDEKLEFLKEVSSVFPTLGKLAEPTSDLTPQSFDPWEDICTELEEFIKDRPQESSNVLPGCEDKTLNEEALSKQEEITKIYAELEDLLSDQTQETVCTNVSLNFKGKTSGETASISTQSKRTDLTNVATQTNFNLKKQEVKRLMRSRDIFFNLILRLSTALENLEQILLPLFDVLAQETTPVSQQEYETFQRLRKIASRVKKKKIPDVLDWFWLIIGSNTFSATATHYQQGSGASGYIAAGILVNIALE